MPSDKYLKQVTLGEVKILNDKINLQEYNPDWADMFEEERKRILNIINMKNVLIEHVGSTSVPNLCAKPILDILLGVQNSADESSYIPALESIGYTLKIREPDWYEHRMLKGFNPEVNLHVFSLDCEELQKMIQFRDWLIHNKDDRERYANVKRMLAKKTWKYLQNYADAKSTIVGEILEHIKEQNNK
ncbi:GrpB family protein [Candidatus Proelusimicrobium volucris]|uniref:GrpB family protein n=1 Tax=Candidatus Proelusimicrobium volucris TaxID=3416225 RepID=UPI003D13AC48